MSSDNSTLTASLRFDAPIAYRYYVLALLMLLGLFAWIDRQILSIVLPFVKVEFALTDTQLGLIGGVAFGLFYVTMGLPMAWLADRGNRRAIIAVSVTLWSFMTALCGVSAGFWSLFFARMGVGVGEAGVGAPSQSLLAEYFPPERRGMVMGLLYSYVPVSYLVSFGLGGWASDAFGWRMTFVVFGLPGILLGALVHLTVREPRRGGVETDVSVLKQPVPSLFVALRSVMSMPTLRRLSLAGASHALGMVAASVWLPTYFIRVHHMSSSAVGVRLALILGLGGLAGTLSGGRLADWAAHTRDERWYAWFCALAVLGTVPFTAAMYLSSNATTALALFVIPSILNHMLLGPTFAAVQNLASPRQRALCIAFYLFAVNLLSMGLGPVLIGFVSDSLASRYGADGLRYALMVLICVASICAGLFYIGAARSLARDRRRTEAAQSSIVPITRAS